MLWLPARGIMQTVVCIFALTAERVLCSLFFIYTPYSGIFSIYSSSWTGQHASKYSVPASGDNSTILSKHPTAVSLASAGEYTTPTTALVLMLNSLTVDLPQAAKDRVFISSGLPTVPKQLQEKIQHWEYVNLAELMPTPSTYDEFASPPAKFTLFPGCEIQRPRRRQIESIIDWVKAFTVYSAALLQKQRNELLACQLTIIKAPQQYDRLQWRAYYTHLHIAAAASNNKTWSKLDTDLYTHGVGETSDHLFHMRQHTAHAVELPKYGSQTGAGKTPHQLSRIRK